MAMKGEPPLFLVGSNPGFDDPENPALAELFLGVPPEKAAQDDVHCVLIIHRASAWSGCALPLSEDKVCDAVLVSDIPCGWELVLCREEGQVENVAQGSTRAKLTSIPGQAYNLTRKSHSSSGLIERKIACKPKNVWKA